MQPAPYAYRNDPAVPPFDDSKPLVVFDGDCVLCSRSMRFLVRIDRARLFRVTPAQGEVGAALYRHLGLPTESHDTYLVLLDGRLHSRSDAITAMAGRLPWPWRAGKALRLLPRPLRDGAYSLLAKNRYRIFGRREACGLSVPELRERLL
jgi:predicted DCC family thiol-disulfide oxidoreductase YuxK